MSLVGFKASNHPQQTGKRGARAAVDDRGTDQNFFDELSTRFGGFDLDVAAAEHNAKCERFYSLEDDGLTQPWTGTVWCNPPYSNLGAWVLKAWDAWNGEDLRMPPVHSLQLARDTAPFKIVMLVPANRVEQAWWQDWVEPYRDQPGSPLRVEFLRGRLRFDRPNAVIGPKGDRPPFGCAPLIWSAPNASVPKESAS
ncbi:phage N-6-adenine-methyltransferase [Nocardioides marmoriginsengisoli]|uniref:phage N-6-adenine-methyltransferase n=1 Tax=Nocardioides marmoriginsengisoli TaxID=661483 RepID=UPI001C835E5B|nr:phage N-6-adenine-methyltransferase [Nocardioides marmoriginsengisoli]